MKDDDWWEVTVHWHVCDVCGEMWSHSRKSVRDREGQHRCPDRTCTGSDFDGKYWGKSAVQAMRMEQERLRAGAL